jgi:3-phenylpropionate/trans-cinnamate dioxygenase ferredoxin subunit
MGQVIGDEVIGDEVIRWVDVCAVDEIEEEDVIGFDHGGATYAVYRLEGEQFHATDGLCTHEGVHLCDGLVMAGIIECPMHNGRFEIATGRAKGAPVTVDLRTHPVKVEAGRVLIGLEA